MDASSPPLETDARGTVARAVRIEIDESGDFLGALRARLASDPGVDIAWIARGIAAPFAWEERLRKAAYAAPRIAAASPLCDLSPLSELVDTKTRAAQSLDAGQLDRTAYVMGDRACYEVPRLHGVCGYLRRDALEAALPELPHGPATTQATLDLLARQWRATGWSCVICDYLYVATPLGATAPEAQTFDEKAFAQHTPLAGLRRAVGEAIAAGLPPVSVPGLDERPVLLHVMHFWGGGLERWVRDFGRADPTRINLILASFRIGETGGQRLVLYSDPAARLPVRVWDIARPMRSSATTSLEYRRILEEIVADFGVEAVLVSSLINHCLDALTLPLRTLLVCHDFYPVCQAINPRFGKTCERCTLDDLRSCAQSNPLNMFFAGQQTSEEWHAMRGLFADHVVRNRVEIVAPSPSVAKTLRQLEPRFEGVPMHVIGHGIDLDAPRVPIAPRGPAQPLRLVVLGRLSIHKGLELLREAAGGLNAHAEITLLGCGKNGVALAEQQGWKAIERYELEDLPGLLRSLDPDACLLPSVVPETFSFTLSELNALAVPALATALGSFRDRIVHGETGFLFEPDKDALVELVRTLKADPEPLKRVARNLGAMPRGRTTADMVADYRALLPLKSHPIARFRVGLGRQSGLTEPYRQLTTSYAQLTGAYQELTGAYDQSRHAYEHAHGEYERTRAELDTLRSLTEAWAKEVNDLELRTHPWRLRQALRLVHTMTQKLQKAEE